MNEIEILNFGKYVYPKDYIYETHNHLHREMFFLVSGTCMMEMEDCTITISKGEGISINDSIEHNFYVIGSGECCIMQIQYLSESEFNVPRYVKFNNAEFVNSGIKCLIHYNKEKSYMSCIDRLTDIEVLKMQILAEKEYTLSLEQKSDKKFFNNIIEYINLKLFEDCNFEQIAMNFGISSRYLRKIFEKELGMSPVLYVANMRIEKAKKILATSNVSITKLAFDLGFNSVQYFSEVFKKQTGISPRDFRKILLIN